MSLSVYLTGESQEIECVCSCGDEHTRSEEEELFCQNITHNLNEMAEQAGIYKHLWRPEEIEIEKAHQLIKPLKIGLEKLKKDPEHFKKFNSPNGWGTYKYFVPFVEEYLKACIEYPDGNIGVSR